MVIFYFEISIIALEETCTHKHLPIALWIHVRFYYFSYILLIYPIIIPIIWKALIDRTLMIDYNSLDLIVEKPNIIRRESSVSYTTSSLPVYVCINLSPIKLTLYVFFVFPVIKSNISLSRWHCMCVTLYIHLTIAQLHAMSVSIKMFIIIPNLRITCSKHQFDCNSLVLLAISIIEGCMRG